MTFDRSALKYNAKLFLKNCYWLSFAVCLILLLPFGILFLLSQHTDMPNLPGLLRLLTDFSPDTFGGELKEFLFGDAVISSLRYYIPSQLICFLIVPPLSVGLSHYFLKSKECGAKLEYVLYGFKSCYKLSVVTNFLRTLLLRLIMLPAYIILFASVMLYQYTDNPISLLWVLLVIPSVACYFIKTYEYMMISYIIAENPNIGWRRAFQLSKQMTDGRKSDLFVLNLSFTGWWLLCAFTCCIGCVFLAPYVSATAAGAYVYLRDRAKSEGYTDDAELPGFSE